MSVTENIREFFARFRSVTHSGEVDRQIDAELQFHIEQQTAAYVASGMPAEEARRRALIQFGGADQIRESVRDEKRFLLMDRIAQDTRFALRSFRKRPAFAIMAILILTVGLGANTAIFAIAKSLLLDRLPFEKPEQLVLINEVIGNDRGYTVSPPNFEDYRAQQKTFQNLSLWMDQSVNLTGGAQPERVVGSYVSANFFDMLGVGAALGRTFVRGEDQAGAARTVILSHRTWQTRFGADPGVLGRSLTLNGEPTTVIGVLPPNFEGVLSDDDIYLPVNLYPNYKPSRGAAFELAMGRLRDGMSREAAIADLNVIAHRIAEQNPQFSKGVHIDLTSLQRMRTEDIRPMLLLLSVAVGLVLVLVCANVANLLLARGAERVHELSIRAALGASRRRVLQQLLTESLLLSLISGALATVLAHLLIVMLLKVNPVALPFPVHARMDAGVLLFIFVLSLLTGLIFGTAPVLQLARPELTQSLAANTRTSTVTRRTGKLRSVFVASQLAISIVLVICSGLLVKTWIQLLNYDPGFNPKNLLTMEYRVPLTKYPNPEAQWNFHRAALNKVQQVPGVISAATSVGLPLVTGNWAQTPLGVPGHEAVPGQEPRAWTNRITPEYFQTIGIPLLQGRSFAESDDAKAPLVVIVNRTLQEQFWPGESAVGKELILFSSDTTVDGKRDAPRHARVVGVASDVRTGYTVEKQEPQIYLAYAQGSIRFGTLVVRTSGDPLSYTGAVRNAVWSMDKDQPVWKIYSMEQLINRDLAPQRALVVLICAFGVLAIILSAAGTYAVISHSVAQRTQEFGVRLALGSTPQKIVALVMRNNLGVAVGGLVAGIVLALLSTRLLRAVLFRVSHTDPFTFVLSIVGMLMVAMLAAVVPAMRASRVPPAAALRCE